MEKILKDDFFLKMKNFLKDGFFLKIEKILKDGFFYKRWKKNLKIENIFKD